MHNKYELAEIFDVYLWYKEKGRRLKKDPEYSKSDAKLYFDDAKDILKIYKAIKRGKFEKALRKARSLDTAVRDAIPKSVWKLIENLE